MGLNTCQKAFQTLLIFSSLFLSSESLLVINRDSISDSDRDPKQFKGQICEENKVYPDPTERDKFYLCRYNSAYRVWIAYAFTCTKYKVFNPKKLKCEYDFSKPSDEDHLQYPGLFYSSGGGGNKGKNTSKLPSAAQISLKMPTLPTPTTPSTTTPPPFNLGEDLVHYDISSQISGPFKEVEEDDESPKGTPNHPKDPWPYIHSLTNTVRHLASSVNYLSQILHVSLVNISSAQYFLDSQKPPQYSPSPKIPANIIRIRPNPPPQIPPESTVQFSLGGGSEGGGGSPTKTFTSPKPILLTTELNILDKTEFDQPKTEELIDYFEEDVKRVKVPPNSIGEMALEAHKKIRTTPRSSQPPSPFRTRTISNDFFPVKVLRYPLSHRKHTPKPSVNTVNSMEKDKEKEDHHRLPPDYNVIKDNDGGALPSYLGPPESALTGRMNSRRPQF